MLYAVLVALLVPNGGGLILLGALTLATTLLRLALPLAWLRSELPGLQLARRYLSGARLRELIAFSWSNFLVHVSNKVVFATDIVVVGIVLGPAAAALYAIPAKLFTMAFGLGSVGTSLLYPALAEHEGAGEEDRQRRLLLAGLRGGMAAAAFLALPMLLIPDLLIEGWVGDGYGESSPVLVLLALVLLVHQPVYLMTQFLIARARQHEIARVLVLAGVANVVLSVTLAATVGLWGVALSTLVTDLAVLAYAAPWLVAPAASLSVGTLARSALRPLVPGIAAALLLFGRPRPGDGSGHAGASCCRSVSPGPSSAGSRSGASASTEQSARRSGASCGRRARRCPRGSRPPADSGRAAPRSGVRGRPSRGRRPPVSPRPRARRAPPSSSPSRTTASTNSRGVGTRTPAPVSRRFSVTS